MFFITAGYHRYFSHRSYRLPRWAQFVLAFGGTTALQKGPLWWAGHHRDHHRYADTDQDVHSPTEGLLVEPRRLDPVRQVRRRPTSRRIKDFAKYPELRWLEPQRLGRPAVALAAWSRYLVGGWAGLVIGFFVLHHRCCGTRPSS